MRRPWYIGLIGWLFSIVGFIQMATILIGVLLVANSSASAGDHGADPSRLLDIPLPAYLGLAGFLSAISFIDGIFLLKAKNWARLLAVTLSVLGVAVNIYAYGFNGIISLQAVFAVLVVFALNTRAAREYFLRLTNA